MRARLGALLMVCAARAASADVTAPVESGGWPVKCGERLRAKMAALGGALGRELAAGRVVAAPERMEYRVGDPRGEELVAALLHGELGASHAWERDEQWNYPIEERLTWRERRNLPDFEAQVAVWRAARGKAPSTARSKAFVGAARAALDQCLAESSRWRPPAGTLHWQLDGFMYQEEFTVNPDGGASLAHHTDGGAVGAMATASAADVDPVVEELRASDFCGLPASALGSKERTETISIGVPSAGNRIGWGCQVSMGESAWQADPRAARCRAAVIALRDKLFRGKALVRP